MSLSEEQRTEILSSLRAGVTLAKAARGMMTTEKACRALAAVDPEWAAAIEAATPAPVVDAEPTPREKREAAAAKVRAAFAALSAQKASEDAAEEAGAVTVAPVPVAERSRIEMVHDMSDGEAARWARLHDEFNACGPGQLGSLRWIDTRCQKAGLRALDPWFDWHFGDFYASGKRIDKMLGGLRLGKSSSVCPALINTLTKQHDVDGGTKLAIPIMSVRREEADDRFYTLCKILSACGVAPKKEDDQTGLFLPGGFGGEYSQARNALSGGGQIKVKDSQGHDIEIRCFPARISGSVGYTSFAAFGDEIDTWPDDPELHANPAEVIVDGLGERTTTQPEAEIFLFSASYHGPETYHARNVLKTGNTITDYCGHLGTLGAERDTAARHRLAALLKSDDPRLLAIADPMSRSVPAWVGNPNKAPIETCYGLAKEDIGRMLGRYGAQPTENSKTKGPAALTIEELDRYTEANTRLFGDPFAAHRTEGIL
jgi:hypothetical protein